MAARFLFQQGETGHATPQQNAAPQVGAVTPSHTPTSAVSSHQIEPELLGVLPRVVSAQPASQESLRHLLLLAVASIHSVSVYWSFYDRVLSGKCPIWAFVALCVPPSIFIFWAVKYSRQSARRVVDFLRRGIATPAKIIAIEQGDRYFRLVIEYQTPSGRCEKTLDALSEGTLSKHNLTFGSTFTLLVSTENDEDVLPYFQASGYRVIPITATRISEEVSARIAAQVANTPVQSVGRLGAIEPELLGPTPRRICPTRTQRRIQAWRFAVLATFVTVILVANMLGISKETLHNFSLGFFVSLVVAMAFWFDKSKELLIRGIPARAFITAEEELETEAQQKATEKDVSFSFQYEQDGKIHTGSFNLRRKRAWQLRIAVGSTFTVLYDAGKPSEHVPYFQIKGYEIIGAMGAKITPP